jgi:hypothetical protein
MTTKLNREIAVRKSLRRSKIDPSKINYLGSVTMGFATGFATGSYRDGRRLLVVARFLRSTGRGGSLFWTSASSAACA